MQLTLERPDVAARGKNLQETRLIQEYKTVEVNNETIESWFDSGWYFRAKIYSNGEWHVWASKTELVARNALHEPWDSVVCFRFGASKSDAIEELLEQIKS